MSNGFTFCLMWNVLENGYLDPHAMTRIDFSKERGRVSYQFPLQFGFMGKLFSNWNWQLMMV